MGKIKRVNISVDEDEWEELPKYIDVNRSEWVRQQVRKQINLNDDVAEIDMKIEAIKYQQKTLDMDLDFLLSERENIIKQRERNEENLKLINDAMFTIRTIVQNQGYIEIRRVEYIANKKVLDSNILLAQCEKEGIEIKKIGIEKEKLIGDGTIKSFKGL